MNLSALISRWTDRGRAAPPVAGVETALGVPEDDVVDLDHSRYELEKAIAAADVLSASQKRNARLMADDLYERRLVWRSVPFRLLVEFNRRCNVKCVHCDIVRAGTGDLPLETVERVLDEIGWGVQEIMPFVGGEPTLAPVHDLVPLARRHGVYLNFITNGQLFTRDYFAPFADIASRVQFSLHSHLPERFAAVVPQVEFDVLVRNIADAVALADETGTHIVPCVVAMNDVVDTLPGYVDFVADLGVHRMIVQKLYPWTSRLEQLDPFLVREPAALDEAWDRVLERARARGVFIETNVERIASDPRNVARRASRFDILQSNVHIVELFRPGFCIATATQTVIEWDGTVLPCIKDHIDQGCIHGRTYDDLWNGEGMRALRRTFFQQALRPYCARCKNFYLGHP